MLFLAVAPRADPSAARPGVQLPLPRLPLSPLPLSPLPLSPLPLSPLPLPPLPLSPLPPNPLRIDIDPLRARLDALAAAGRTADGACCRLAVEPGSLRAWGLAVRPKTLWIATIPVIVATCLAWSVAHAFDPQVAAIALAFVVALSVMLRGGWPTAWRLVRDLPRTPRGPEQNALLFRTVMLEVAYGMLLAVAALCAA